MIEGSESEYSVYVVSIVVSTSNDLLSFVRTLRGISNECKATNNHSDLAFIQKQLGDIGELVVDVVKPLFPCEGLSTAGVLPYKTRN